MSLTILAAQWGNEDQTSAVIATQERGAVAISEVDRPDEWANFLNWVALGNAVAPLPGPSAAQQRAETFLADITRADIIDKLMNATLAQIDTYVDNNIASTNVTTLRNECRALFKKIIKALALNVQR